MRIKEELNQHLDSEFIFAGHVFKYVLRKLSRSMQMCIHNVLVSYTEVIRMFIKPHRKWSAYTSGGVQGEGNEFFLFIVRAFSKSVCIIL